MNEATIDFVRDTRQSIRAMMDGSAAMLIWLATFLLAAIISITLAQVMPMERAIPTGIGSAVSFLIWGFTLLWSNRAWLLSRAAFEVVADGIAENSKPVTEEPAEPDTKPSDPVPAPEPAAAPMEPFAQITADDTLMQLLLDMPSEKLQAILDARAMRNQ